MLWKFAGNLNPSPSTKLQIFHVTFDELKKSSSQICRSSFSTPIVLATKSSNVFCKHDNLLCKFQIQDNWLLSVSNQQFFAASLKRKLEIYIQCIFVGHFHVQSIHDTSMSIRFNYFSNIFSY